MSRQDNLVVHRGGVIVISDVGARGATGLTGATGATGAMGNPGGPVTIPYTFSTTTTDADPGNGHLRFNQATQDTTTVLRLDLVGSDATSWTTVIDTFDDSTSTIKGYIRVSKASNPALWMLFSIASLASPSGYRNITVTVVSSSGPNPFNDGDAVNLMFTRNGDKGDTGATGPQGDFNITTDQTITGVKTFNQGKLRDKGTYVYDVKAYGALGDGSTDDTAAVQSVITAISSTGGVVFFPPGTYIFASALDLKATHNVILRGQGGRSAGAGNASILKYTGSTGGTNFIDGRSALGLEIADLQIIHTGAFTGRMIDLRLNTSGGAYIKLKNLYVGGNSNYSATGLDLSNTTRIFVESCAFYQLGTCITGKVNNADNSNQVRIQDCGFNQSPVAIHNPGQAWVISSCCFEGSAGGGAANAVDHGAGILAEGLIIEGNWSGDSTGGTQYTVAGEGITIQGNWIGNTSGTGISIDESTQGLHITGNKFIGSTTAINISTNIAHAGMRIHGNSYSGVTTKLVGVPNGTSVMGFPLVYDKTGEVETNLLSNPSFDTNTTGWTSSATFYTNTGATLTRITTDHAPLDDPSGACLQVDYTNALNHHGPTVTVTSVPGSTLHIFTAWIKNMSGRTVSVQLRDTTNSVTGTSSTSVATTGIWTRVTASITTGASTASVLCAIDTDSSTGTGQFFIDECRFGVRGAAETQMMAQLRRALANSGIINDLTV